MNNGNFSEFFVPTRGLLQGNPIASYLFLLVVEILGQELRKNPKIEGINKGSIVSVR